MATINFAEAKAFSINESNLAQIVDPKSTSVEWFREAYCQIALTIRKTFHEAILNQSKKNSSPELNNVIAITGDRGTGKSGVMHSVLRYLEKGSDPTGYTGMSSARDGSQSHAEILDELSKKADSTASKFTSFKNCTFSILPTLDPTKLPKEETLVGFIIANIYKNIIETIENDSNFDAPKYEKVIELCDKSLEALRIRTLGLQTSMKGNPDDLDMLGKLANTSDLRSSLKNLIDAYLKMRAPRQNNYTYDSPHSRFLVISIDDLDANIDAGYQLAEELRNYLFIPQVIILMAVKTEQLSDIVQQHFLSVFSEMCKSDGVLDAQPDEMATKYIQKLIPDQRRIHLPSIISYSVNSVSVCLPASNCEDSTKEEEEKSELPLTDYFFSLIRDKSTILLVKNSREGHGLLPMNLRSLHQIIDLLENMPSVVLSDDGKMKNADRRNLHNNLRRLSDWIVDSVSSNSIPRNLAVTFRAMAAHPNYGLNGYLVSLLRKYLSASQSSTLFGSDDIAAEIVDIKTLPQNISIGDIFYLLNKIEQYNSGEGFIHYAAAVRLLYSIRLTAAYYPVGETDEQKPDFDSILTILNGLIYTPTIKLTPTGLEWMPNQDSTRFVLKGKPSLRAQSSDGKQQMDVSTPNAPPIDIQQATNGNNFIKIDLTNDEAKSSDGTALPIKSLMWLSFFAVQYGSRLRKGLPSSHRDGRYLDSRFVLESDAFYGFISFNWLAFIHNALNPLETVTRLLGYGFSKELEIITGQNEANAEYEGFLEKADITAATKFYKEIAEWKEEYATALPVRSAEVIYCLINSLEKNRLRPREGHTRIGEFNEFPNLINALKYDLEETLRGIKFDESSSYFKNYIAALEKCPLIEFGMELAKEEDSKNKYLAWFIS